MLGHSGSGKSTLVRTLAKLDPVVEGRVEQPSNVSVVFQKAGCCRGSAFGRTSCLGRIRGMRTLGRSRFFKRSD